MHEYTESERYSAVTTPALLYVYVAPVKRRLSNRLTTDFRLEAVQEAITRYGIPEIFNTDQGCQFTRQKFTRLPKQRHIAISMDGTGCWRDNVFVERLWRSVKYEEVYRHAYETTVQPNRA